MLRSDHRELVNTKQIRKANVVIYSRTSILLE